MYWAGWFHMPLGWVLICLATMGLCVLFTGGGRSRNSALRKLNERFGRGKIGDSEYKAKLEAILLQ